MSFTSEIKTELCRLQPPRPCCALAELLGMLLYARRCDGAYIRLQNENNAVRRRAAQLLRQLVGVTAEEDGSALILEGEDASAVMAAFGYGAGGAIQLNRALVEEDCCRSALLRGAFLAGGYVSTPDKGYHLELVTGHYHVARQVSALLMEMEMPPAALQRRGTHVLYYKDSTHIEEFLTTVGATGSAMELMLKKVERDLRNRVNRQVNCETANLSKTVAASGRQIAAIRALRARGELERLPEAVQETARLREQHPELSLTELCALHSVPISRPGLSSRLRKLTRLGEEGEMEP